jgi:hypothetical protein
MAYDIPDEIAKNLIETADQLIRNLKNFRFSISDTEKAISIENIGILPGNSSATKLDISIKSLDGKTIQETHILEGEQKYFPSPLHVYKHEVIESGPSNEGEIEEVKLITERLDLPQYNVKSKLVGEFIQVKISNDSQIGEQTLLRVKNFHIDPYNEDTCQLNVLYAIPDEFPFPAYPPYFVSYALKTNDQISLQLMQPLNEKAKGQVIMYFSYSRDWLTPVLKPEIEIG